MPWEVMVSLLNQAEKEVVESDLVSQADVEVQNWQIVVFQLQTELLLVLQTELLLVLMTVSLLHR